MMNMMRMVVVVVMVMVMTIVTVAMTVMVMVMAVEVTMMMTTTMMLMVMLMMATKYCKRLSRCRVAPNFQPEERGVRSGARSQHRLQQLPQTALDVLFILGLKVFGHPSRLASVEEAAHRADH